MTGLAITLTIVTAASLALRRYARKRRFRKCAAALQRTHELWELAQALPGALVSNPIRDALVTTFTGYAERLGAAAPKELFGKYAAILGNRAALVRALPKKSQGNLREAELHAERFRRLSQLLGVAREDKILPEREYALAKSASGLAAELCEVDALCASACQAKLLKADIRAERLKATALARCDQLPRQTGEEMKRTVIARIG